MVAGTEFDQCATGQEILNQQSEKQSFPNTNLDRLGKTGSYLKTSQLHCFALHKIYLGSFRPCWLAIVPKLWFLRSTVSGPKFWFLQSCLCCRDLGSFADKHSLEEQLWHLAFTTSAVATFQVARRGWLPRQAKLPLHCGWRRTWQMFHWPWNVKSTIRKSQIFPITNLDRLGKTGRYLQLRSFTFLHCTNSIEDQL